MALQDKEKQLAQRLMALLVRDTDWANEVRAGNRINPYTELSHTVDKVQTADGDYPQAKLRCMKGSNSFFDDDVTFVTHSPEFDPASYQWKETNVWNFRLELISKSLSANETSPLAAYTRRALRAGGPRLGTPTLTDEDENALPAISGVTSVKMTWETNDEETEDDEMDGTRREKTTFEITIETVDEGSTQQET